MDKDGNIVTSNGDGKYSNVSRPLRTAASQAATTAPKVAIPGRLMAVAFVGIVRSGELAANTAHTLRSILIGWLLALVIGGALGLIFGLSRFARRYFLASLEVLRPLPAIAFLPVALLLFNFSLTTELVVMVYASIWPMFINTMGGIANVASRLHDVSLTLKLSRLDTLLKVLLPAAAPAILVGARLCLGTTLVMAIIAEMIGNPHGLGYAVVSALMSIQPEQMFAYVLFIGVLAIAPERLSGAGGAGRFAGLWP